jgi:hypothetical protein
MSFKIHRIYREPITSKKDLLFVRNTHSLDRERVLTDQFFTMNLTQTRKLVVAFNQIDNQGTCIEIKHPFDSEPFVAVLFSTKTKDLNLQNRGVSLS